MKAAAWMALCLAAASSATAAVYDARVPAELVWTTSVVSDWGPGAVLQDLSRHHGQVKGVAFSPDGRRAASAGEDGAVLVWDVTPEGMRASGDWLLRLRAEAGLTSLAWSPDGRLLAAADAGGAVHLWEAATGKPLRSLPPAGSATQLAFSPDGRRLCGAGWEKLACWDAETGKVLRSGPLTARGEREYDGDPDLNALSPDASVAAAQSGGRIALFAADTGAALKSWAFKAPAGLRGALALSAGGQRVAAVSGRTVVVWDAAGRELASFKTDAVKSFDTSWTAALSADGRRLAVSAASDLSVWDVDSRRRLRHDERGEYDWASGQSALAFSGDGERLLEGYRGGEAALSPSDSAAGSGRALSEDSGTSPTACLKDNALSLPYMFPGDQRSLAVRGTLASCVPAAPGPRLGFDLVADCLKQMQRDARSQASAPTAPTLTQGAYESTPDFEARVAKAKGEYERQVEDYRKRLDSASVPAEGFPAAFMAVFGAPRVSDVSYDPDARRFTLSVLPSSEQAGDFKLRLALREEVPNDQAEKLAKELAGAAIRVAFRVEAGRFSLESALVDGRVALPADLGGAAGRAPAVADVGAGVAVPEARKADEVALGFAENPALAAKERELAEQRRKQADAEKLAALEKQIRDLRRGDEDKISSDVDQPVASRPEDPRALAVVVGVEGYQDADLPAARFAERDAQAVARRLQSLGVAPRNMKVLIGADATRAKLAAVLEEWLPSRAAEGAKVYFYFSGHGAPDPASGDAYLVPWDGDASLLKRTGFPLRSLYADLEKVPAARRVAVLDACFSGAGGRSLLAKGARPLVLARAATSGKVTVLAAASASQITATLEDQGHGLFTYQFLKALGEGGKPASALYAELKPKVEDEAARQSREQSPAFSGPDAPIP